MRFGAIFSSKWASVLNIEKAGEFVGAWALASLPEVMAWVSEYG
jgi:hypothetical protein